MKCIRCEQEARAVCQFCGRAVCASHVSEKRFVTGFSSKLGFWSFAKNAVVVNDAVWCGICHPEYKTTG